MRERKRDERLSRNRKIDDRESVIDEREKERET